MLNAKLERAYRSFVRCHHVVAEAPTEEALLHDVCAAAVNELGFVLAWVGLVSPDEPRVRPVAQAGYEAGYLASVEVTWGDDEHGQGPTGRAIRERRSQVAQDIRTDSRYAPWREDALQRGYASSAAIPLCDGSRCVGALNLYAAEPDAFDDDEIALLEEMAVDIVLGLGRLRARQQLDAMQLHVERAGRAEAAIAAVAALAHDVNNLLQVISLAIEAAHASVEGDARERLDEAARASDAAAAITRQLLSTSRRALESELHAGVDQVVRGLAPLLSRLASRAKLHVAPGADDVHARIASLELERVLINLVLNAGQALSAEGGTIEVSTGLRHVEAPGATTSTGLLAPGSYVDVSVADSGVGIAPEVLPRIFEPFFTTKASEGTGLGLAAVLAIARDAGGAVSVSSQLGQGTRFTVHLPALEPR